MTNERTLQRFSEGLAVLKSREQEALKLYRPMATQAPFHASGEMVRLVRGGNRCLWGTGNLRSCREGFAKGVRDYRAVPCGECRSRDRQEALS